LVNEVRVSDHRINKANSFVNSGLLSDQIRTFNLQEIDKKGIVSFRQGNEVDKGSKYQLAAGPGQLIATSNRLR
jgi:hypothetical protein